MATETKDYGLLAKKVGMTQIFDEEGNVVPVTVLELAENIVTDIKTEERDGYNAVQVGNFLKREKLIKKPELAKLQKKNLPALSQLDEFRTHEAVEGLSLGDAINLEEFFQDLAKVKITGTSIGKGFQGGVKRHNMHVGRRSHGSKSKRQVGSSGAGTYPGRVFKGKRMPGRMGNKQISVTKAKVVKFCPEKRLVLIKGPVPGKKGAVLKLRASGIKSWNHYNKQSA
ncbi:MAG: 50S ribosomal protein L3 [Candidatus Melainabacteria bacterium]|nr:50S ribosomal protein L3 [Candidatus Melainabacteria bacterium]